MAYRSKRLPSRFPVGTKFVIESRRSDDGQIYSRYLEFPDGTQFPLPARPALAQRKSTLAPRRRRQH